MRIFPISVFLILIAIINFGFRSFEINPFDYLNERDLKILKALGLNLENIPEQILVIEADNLSEFVNISNAPHFLSAITRDGKIFIQNKNYLLKKFDKTLKHEVLHVILHALDLPYFLEEGLVCELTEEWKGRKRSIINVENTNYTELRTLWELESYSYSCWIKIKEIFGF
ncbi:MAG: hypothetical protein PWQ20_588 [Thermotogaceae bacterium]|nr:hypothetical protein [Thermotogaceae bacterium]